jgi:hypothetical protein
VLNEKVRADVPVLVAAVALIVTTVRSFEPGGAGSEAVRFNRRPFAAPEERKRQPPLESTASPAENIHGFTERRWPLNT